jgi:hypothetical protein
MIPPLELTNGTVVPLEKRRPGSDDVVSHTLRHFIREGAYFPSVPGGELDGADARRQLLAAGIPPRQIRELPVSHDNLDARWSLEDRRDRVEFIHDQGYGPRYLGLVRDARFPGDPGSTWVRDQGRYEGGYSLFPLEWNVWVCASWDRWRRVLKVLSARDRAPMVGDGAPRRKPVDEDLERLRSMIPRR